MQDSMDGLHSSTSPLTNASVRRHLVSVFWMHQAHPLVGCRVVFGVSGAQLFPVVEPFNTVIRPAVKSHSLRATFELRTANPSVRWPAATPPRPSCARRCLQGSQCRSGTPRLRFWIDSETLPQATIHP